MGKKKKKKQKQQVDIEIVKRFIVDWFQAQGTAILFTIITALQSPEAQGKPKIKRVYDILVKVYKEENITDDEYRLLAAFLVAIGKQSKIQTPGSSPAIVGADGKPLKPMHDSNTSSKDAQVIQGSPEGLDSMDASEGPK